jgi:hypothetical protein
MPVKHRLLTRLRSPALFALVFQGIMGLVQVEAFVSLQGEVYLAFSAAYLLGTVLSLLLVLNFENMILGGRWTTNVRRYFAAVWVVGLGAALAAVATRAQVPSFVAFCCFGVCFRMFLAWANHAQPAPPSLVAAGGLVLASCLLADLGIVMLSAMLAFPLATWGARAPAAGPDDGLLTITRQSLLAFAKYLPHTLSGLAVGYVDRYVALQVVGGVDAETYLRTVQVCSWAAFLAYPVVFHARAQVLRAGELRIAGATRIVGLVATIIGVAVVFIVALAHGTGRLPVLAPWAVAIVFAAIVCSQGYQVASSLNFVGERFGAINRITLASAATVLLLAFTIVPIWRSAEALALVLLSGWLVQFTLTVIQLQRRRR